MPGVVLSTEAAILLDVVAWAAVHASTGYLVHRLSPGRLARDSWILRPRAFERGGRFYQRSLRISSWKDRLPEAGAFFRGGVSKRWLPSPDRRGLTVFVRETRRAELGHWSALAAGPFFALWNPVGATTLLVAYGALANLPFIAIQRYNRLRAQRLLEHRRELR